MKKNKKSKWEGLFNAITFAEEGEFVKAQQFLNEIGLTGEEIPLTDLEGTFEAITFAEVGEFEIAKQVLINKKRILLIWEEKVIEDDVLLYTLNLSKRLKFGVDILFCSEKERDWQKLKFFVFKLKTEGIPFDFIKIDNYLKLDNVVLSYIKSHKDIDFIVLKVSKENNKDQDEKLFEKIWNKIGCPFILVKEKIA